MGFTEKYMNREKRTKAILAARGFEELNSEILKDSPTCTKESLKLVLLIISTKGWNCKSIDVKATC